VRNRSSGINIDEPASNPSSAPTFLESTRGKVLFPLIQQVGLIGIFHYVGFFFLLPPSYRNPRDIFPDSFAKNPQSSNQTLKDEENLSSCGTKSSAHMSKALSPNNASPGTANTGPCDMENPPSSESAEPESTKTTPPNNPSDGIRIAGEDSTTGDSAHPQTQSLPR
jgi:hypothetical protein